MSSGGGPQGLLDEAVFPLLSAKQGLFLPCSCFFRGKVVVVNICWKIQDLHIFKKTICLWSVLLTPSPANASFEWPLDFRKGHLGYSFLSWITYCYRKKENLLSRRKEQIVSSSFIASPAVDPHLSPTRQRLCTHPGSRCVAVLPWREGLLIFPSGIGNPRS